MSQWLSAKNILAVRLDNAGDVLMLSPALRAVKERSPEARITLLASPAGAAAASLLPWVDDVIVWRAVWQALGQPPGSPGQELQLVTQLTAGGFDGALIFTSFSQSPLVPAYVCYLAGIPLRAGESKEFGGAVLTTALRPAPDELHQVERNLRLVESLGFDAADRRLVASIPGEAREVAPRLLAAVGLNPHAPFILVHPGASAPARRYPADQLGRAIGIIASLGYQVLVTGTEREQTLIQSLARHAPVAGYLCGATTMAEYAALIDRAALVVCNNTLPLHLADALLTPALCLYAGTDLVDQWRPRQTRHLILRRQTPCTPCYLIQCPLGLECLAVPPEEIVEAALQLLSVAPVRLSFGFKGEVTPCAD